MSAQKVFKTALYTVIPYDALPCKLNTFTVKNQPASTSDFGYSEDTGGTTGDEDIDHWGCSNRQWFHDNGKRNAAMKTYGITSEEFDEICDILESVLCVGRCGWCI